MRLIHAKLRFALILILGLASLSACSYFRSTPTPIGSLRYTTTEENRTLLLLLPGRGDKPANFVDQRWLYNIEEHGLAVDIIIVNAHLGYYLNNSIAKRIHEDILTLSTLEQYSQIWIAGVSLGGMGALEYTRNYPCEIDGLILIAPYLGPNRLIDSIVNSGGLEQWHISQPETDPFERLWNWLKYEGPMLPDTYLAYGLKDPYALGHQLFEREVVTKQVLTDEGGHNWRTWNRLWRRLLGSPDFQRRLTYSASQGSTSSACLKRR